MAETMTPETLIAVPARALEGDLLELDLHLRSHAGAWGAEQKQALLTLRAYNMKCADLMDAKARIEALESLRRTGQAFVDAPNKFGIRHKAYLYLCRALDGLAGEEQDANGR